MMPRYSSDWVVPRSWHQTDGGDSRSISDPLTGLHNRRFALHRMEQMMSSKGEGPSVMMIDLDFFKAINDTYGHAAGDTVLQQVSHRLRAQLRGNDLLARIGGEEFLVALPDTDRIGAIECAERLRHAVGGAAFELGADILPINVTASVGLALPGDQTRSVTPEMLIQQADTALYGAKAHGRNQVSQVCVNAA